ncbi:lasso peptide biosynthesis B2 protein [Streptacidiphilus sp. P02-A3a]|uniref:lasso peptide biosynthesis B2 protein n=1 Tax=Streptacidiphilus sp. P02-A3a TaxID=2704468 RepID=UPI0015F8DFF7|nr:lasso peptide biosynthesis B2 protein [Streptacidiphilus sp. P02-A3a]
MSRANTVAAITSYVCLLVDYDTGRTELRPASEEAAALAGHVIVLPEPSLTWGTVEQRAALAAVPSSPLRWRVGAVAAVLVTAGALMLGRRRHRFRRLAWLACSGRKLRPATACQARYAVCAVRWAARLMPTRWACMEESTSAAVLLVLARRRAEWQHGVAVDPARLHAWINDSDGNPVEEPADTSLYTATYTPDGPASVGTGRELQA